MPPHLRSRCCCTWHPAHVVRNIVGHSDIEVTMTIYAHTSLDDKRAALRKLGEASAEDVAVRVAIRRPGTVCSSGPSGWF